MSNGHQGMRLPLVLIGAALWGLDRLMRRATTRQGNRTSGGQTDGGKDQHNANPPAVNGMEENRGKNTCAVCRYQEKQPKPLFRRTGFWIAAFALCQFLTTAVYTVFTYRLWVTTNASVQEAVASNIIAREGNEAQARAWIVPSVDLTATCPSADRPIIIEGSLVNSGNRPAVDAITQTMTWIAVGTPGYLPFPFPIDPVYPPIGMRVQSAVLAAPNAKLFDRIERPLTGGEANALNGRQATLFVYGKATYEDGYGIERHTVFCFYWYPERDCSVYSFRMCDSYNGAD